MSNKQKNRSKKIPRLKNEDEEREFWSTHDATDYFDWNNAVVNPIFPNLKLTTKPITIRLPEWLIHEIKSLANVRDVPYQSLIKTFLVDRVKKEW